MEKRKGDDQKKKEYEKGKPVVMGFIGSFNGRYFNYD